MNRLTHHALALLTLPALAPAQDGFLSVPNEVMQTVGAMLPEASNAGASFISSVYDPNIRVSATCEVSVAFLWEGAGYRNSLGYFTYTESETGELEITSSELLIADASFPRAGNAQIGDMYTLKDASGEPRFFEAGDRIGFFVIANGWNKEPAVRAWDSESVSIPSVDPNENRKTGYGCFTTLDQFNPENVYNAVDLARHVAMLKVNGVDGFLGSDPFLVVGFEDLLRTGNSDDDFNDLVFTVQATPSSAIVSETEVLEYEAGDPDEDGVAGTSDQYPNDPERSCSSRFPGSGSTVIGVEDLYPATGDADFNDVLLGYDYQVVCNAEQRVKDIIGTYHLVARGAGYDHAVRLRIPGLQEGTTGTVSVERFLSDGTVEQEGMSLSDVIANGNVCPDLFPSTKAALPPNAGSQFTNTDERTIDGKAASVRIHIVFDEAVRANPLGTAPYDLFVAVKRPHGETYDIHLPGQEGLPSRPNHLPSESDEKSFLDEEGRPWMLTIPTEWRFPLERVRVWDAYPEFNDWTSTGGKQSSDWYLRPSTEVWKFSYGLRDYLPVRDWSIGLD